MLIDEESNTPYLIYTLYTINLKIKEIRSERIPAHSQY